MCVQNFFGNLTVKILEIGLRYNRKSKSSVLFLSHSVQLFAIVKQPR